MLLGVALVHRDDVAELDRRGVIDHDHRRAVLHDDARDQATHGQRLARGRVRADRLDVFIYRSIDGHHRPDPDSDTGLGSASLA